MMLEGSFRAVIEGPARLVEPPLTVDPQLTDALLEDISGQDALPLLAFTLAHLYDNTRVDNALTLVGYDKIGRVKGVIDKTVAQAFAEAAARAKRRRTKRSSSSSRGRPSSRIWRRSTRPDNLCAASRRATKFRTRRGR